MSSERAGLVSPLLRPCPALVVDSSAVFAHFLGRLLSTRFDPVIARITCDEAREAIEVDDYDLVVVDLEAKGDPLALIDAIRERPGARAAILAVTHHRDLMLEAQLSMRGAIGVLEKPIVPGALFRALRGLNGAPFRAADPRARLAPDATAEILDGQTDEVLLRWEIRDVSRSGAFLLSHGPIGVGERLRMRLCLGDEALSLEGEVVRIQEPGWSVLPGVAVRFRDPDPASVAQLDRLVARWFELCEARARGGPGHQR